MGQEKEYGGLASAFDPTKTPVYDTTDTQQQKLVDAQKEALQALEKRYEQPNWFKVAAGFAKPQLGGFVASLGSASEALGENIEQQRAQQLPIAEMRARLAQNEAVLGNRKKAADALAAWKKSAKPGELPPAELVMHVSNLDPTMGKSLSDITAQNINQRTLSQKEQEQAMIILEKARNQGLISTGDYNARVQQLMTQSPMTTPNRTEPLADVGGKAPAAVAGTTTVPPAGGGAPAAGGDADAMPPRSKMTSTTSVSTTGEETKPPAEYTYTVQLPKLQGQPDKDYDNTVATRRETAKQNELRTEKQMEPILVAGNPSIQNNYDQAANSVMQIARDDPKAFAAIHNLVRKGGPLAAAAQQGFAAHFGNINANFSLPVEAYQRAKLPKEYWSTADTLLGNYISLANIGMKLEGRQMTKFDPNEADTVLARYAGLQQTPDAALLNFKHNRADFDMQRRIAKEYPKIMSRIQKEHPDEMAPHTAAYNSPELEQIRALYAQVRELENQKHRRGTSRKP